MGVPIKSIGGNPIVPDQISGGATEGNYALLTAGAADGIKGGGPTVDAAFLHRVTGGGQASDGPATIEVIRGNTVRWNQLMNTSPYWNDNGNTSHTVSDDVVTVTATATNPFGVYKAPSAIGNGKGLVVGHKYCGIVDVYPSVGFKAYFGLNSANVGTDPLAFGKDMTVGAWNRISGIATLTTLTNAGIRIGGGGLATLAAGDNFQMKNVMLFDLTVMFGSGNEPSTVAEFEALYPLPYYAYDAGSLLSVQMEGVESVGFNLLDGTYAQGGLDGNTGAEIYNANWSRTGFIPVFPDTSYYLRTPGTGEGARPHYYDADKNFIGTPAGGMSDISKTYATPLGTRYVRLMTSRYPMSSEFCLNLSDPARNGTYEPYRGQTRSIDVASYFPDGMRGVGTAADLLYKDRAETHIGVVDLGTLGWYAQSINGENGFAVSLPAAVPPQNNNLITIDCAQLTVMTGNGNWNATGLTNIISLSDVGLIQVRHTASTVSEFKTAMNGVLVFYILKTPTTTQIDPPINMSYRAEQGGTETVIVSTGEMSAPVPMVVVYGSTPDGILDRSASLLAAQDGPTATANHSVGSYLTMGGQLYKVTTAIASGEAIVPGTNVTATTVMAEVLSLIQ